MLHHHHDREHTGGLKRKKKKCASARLLLELGGIIFDGDSKFAPLPAALRYWKLISKAMLLCAAIGNSCMSKKYVMVAMF